MAPEVGVAFLIGCVVGGCVVALALLMGRRLHDRQPFPSPRVLIMDPELDPRAYYRHHLAELREQWDAEQVTKGGTTW